LGVAFVLLKFAVLFKWDFCFHLSVEGRSVYFSIFVRTQNTFQCQLDQLSPTGLDTFVFQSNPKDVKGKTAANWMNSKTNYHMENLL
jgi:hypothetical protein